MLEQANHRLEDLDPDAAPADRELREARREDRATLVDAEQRADAGAVKTKQIDRELRAELRGDRVNDRGAEAGVDAVERLATLDAHDDRRAVLAHPFVPRRIVGQRQCELAARHACDVLVSDARVADREALGHEGALQKSKKLNQFNGADRA